MNIKIKPLVYFLLPWKIIRKINNVISAFHDNPLLVLSVSFACNKARYHSIRGEETLVLRVINCNVAVVPKNRLSDFVHIRIINVLYSLQLIPCEAFDTLRM